MKSDLNIAVAAQDAELVARHIGRALGVEFTGHDSSYKGNYWLYEAGDSTIEVFYNNDPMFRSGDPPEDQWFQAAYKEFTVLINAYGSPALCAQVWSATQAGYPSSVVIGSNAAQQGIQPDGPASGGSAS